ncbi:S8 family peptidase [Faecalicatena contorta]|uniref:Subtilase family protein n=1 Tax=Faecalicatena contorta TaxID=39482 RepID=A0A316A1W8_9FIRM|nr:S8 family peptidase [Faecalicatena contorta]PWJ51583.1 subtilase family protein [Faecalicatena contorta]SUQ13139.1 Subtilase family protein [Faecalicatena contorta]
MEQSICKERILSEDYHDFIISETRPFPIPNVVSEQFCAQYANYGYRCVYLSRILTEPINMSKYDYTSIPKCYSPLSMEALNQSGILQIQNYPTLQLRGQNIMIGFIDTGIDYTNSVFRNLDGTTRIAAIWDQTIQTGTPPQDLIYGSEYTREMINEALLSDDPRSIVPTEDEIGHGTFVASVAAGSGDPSENFLGAAPESTIAVVKLKQAKQYLRDFYYIPDSAVCFQETDLMLGLKYLSALAQSMDIPLVMCLAIGTNMGGHIDVVPLSKVLEHYGAAVNQIPVVGGGNEADKRHHYSHTIRSDDTPDVVEIRVGENVAGFTMELWTDIPNVFSVALVSPSGESTATIPIQTDTSTIFNFVFERTQVSVDYSIIVERTISELIFLRFSAPTPGIWSLIVTPVRAISGLFHIWLPMTEFLSGEVYFLNSDPYYTLTNPGNARGVVVVSFYDGDNNSIALSSGRGYTRDELINPHVAAPGLNITGALPGGRFAVRSGSSTATGITAGAVALLLEWMLKDLGYTGVDAYELRSLLILGAIRPASMLFPNREWGYGKLNLYNTLEEMRNI